MKRVWRIDAGGELAKPERTPEGWLRVDGHTARTGILEYDQPDGSVVRELVLPEELFDADSMASARMVPVTNQHPDKLLDAQTAKAHQVGSVGENIRPDGSLLAASMMITDAATVAAIEAGGTGLSWGYDCVVAPPDLSLVATWGEHNGIQRKRRYNHIASNVLPRAGDQARIRLDSDGNARAPFGGSAGPVVEPKVPVAPAKTENPAMKIKLRKHHLDASEANSSIVQEAIDRELAESDSRCDAADKAKTAAEQERDSIKARLDGFKASVAASYKRLRARLDAMKARMMGCDECGGSGKVMDAAGAEAKCDYCDGAGALRMHEMVKGMAPAAEDALPDDDMVAMGDDLSGEPASEEAQEKAANPAHDDPKASEKADAKKARKADCATARKRRLDSMARTADRRSRSRAALLSEAGKHVDSAEIAAKSDHEIRLAVVTKLAPHVDASKMDAASVGVLYASETARAKAEAPNPSAQMVQSAIPVGGPAQRSDAAARKANLDKAIADANAKLYAQ